MPAEAAVETAIGRGIPRLDSVEKVLGHEHYVGDLRVEGMLYARIVRSPYPHATVRGVDPTAALSEPGVLAVLHAGNTPRLTFETRDDRAHGGPLDTAALLDSEARHVGDEVAVVVAEMPDAAERALALVEVDYDEQAFVIDAEEALGDDAPAVRGRGNLAGGEPLRIAWGDVEQGLAEADVVLERTYRTAATSAIPLEPRAALAWWDGDALTVQKTSRGVFLDRDALARVFGVPAESIRVVSPALGASFGNKDESRVGALAALAAREVGRPVLLTTTLEEELRAGRWRHASLITLRTGLKRSGEVTALDARATFNSGPYAPGQHVNRRAGFSLTYLYRCPNVRYEGRVVYTNAPVAGSYRAPGGAQAHFALESHMDEAARVLGIDPFEFRLRNRVGPEGQPGERRTPLGEIVAAQPDEPGLPFSSHALDACIRKGAEAFGWHDPKPANDGRVRTGRGLAIGIYQTGQVPAAAVTELAADGTIHLRMGTKDVGQGSSTVLTQVAAEALGVDMAVVRSTFADTSETPRAHMTAGSSTTFSSGLAAQRAAAQLRTAILEAAARLLEASPADLTLIGDRVEVRGAPSTGMTLRALAERLGDARPRGEASLQPGSTTHLINSFTAHFAEVEVDAETGQVNVTRFVAAHDAGRILNPLLARGQVEGAVVQALGYAVMEYLAVDEYTGAPVASNLNDFRIPTTLDVPEIQVVFVDSFEPNGPFGAKSLAEVPMLAVAPAIANAIYDAVGVRLRSLPLRAPDVLEALSNASDH